MNKERFKKVLIRFFKEKNVYSFMCSEINKEYNNGLYGFIEKIEEVSNCCGVFNTTSILSFSWHGKTENEEEKARNVKFWKNISDDWKRVCAKEHFFREY